LLSASRTLGSAAARRIVEAAIAEAERGGWRIAVAVVDPSGLPIALARMDEVTPPILDFAQDKAYTAATMRRSAPTLAMGFQNRPRLMVWGGGLPIFHEGLAVGGVGVSGAKEAEDVACARAGIAAIGLGWEG
jgi:uncharacterized protein GlcG (DUF336 family)